MMRTKLTLSHGAFIWDGQRASFKPGLSTSSFCVTLSDHQSINGNEFSISANFEATTSGISVESAECSHLSARTTIARSSSCRRGRKN